MSPEIGAQRQFIERRGGPAYDWNQTTLTLDAAPHSLDLSSIVPVNALWVKFLVTLTAPTNPRSISFRPTTAVVPLWADSVFSFNAPLSSTAEIFLKLSSPQLAAYAVSSQITLITLRVLGWML